LNEQIILSKKEKQYFDMLIDDLPIIDAIHILTEISLKSDSIKIEPDHEEDNEGYGPEAGVLPKDKLSLKSETGMNPAPKYDTKNVIENSFSIYV
jgi:hypothetical protein